MVAVHPLPRGTPSLATAIGVVLATAIAFLLVRPGAAENAEIVVVRDSAAAAPVGASGTADITSYRVRPGDTVSEVAQLHAVPTAAVVDRNGLAPPYRIRAGERLAIPAAPSTAPPPQVQALDSPRSSEVVAAAERWGRAYGLSPELIKALCWKESRWQPDAVSHKGAVGVAQTLPGTARWVSSHLVGERLDPMEIDDNVRISAAYLRWLLDRSGGDTAAALAAYHQGRASTLNRGWLPVTERYVQDVFELWFGFRSASAD